MPIQSPSRWVVEIAQQPLIGPLVAKADDTCALCCGPIYAGEPVDLTSTLGASFNNKADAAHKNGTLICGACNAVSERHWMERLSKAYVTADGVFKLASNPDQAYFILNAPKPPYVAYLSDGKMQHLIWRSTMTVDHDLTYIRLGERQLSFSRSKVKEALATANQVIKFMARSGAKGKTPFANYNRELETPQATRIRPDVLQACETDPVMLAACDQLEALTIGEYWALGILLLTDPEKIEKPIRLTV